MPQIRKLPRGLYAIIDDGLPTKRTMYDRVCAAIEGGSVVMQLRLERTSDREALKLLDATMKVASAGKVTVIVNDRVDWALASGADGVHVGADDFPVAVARSLLPKGSLIGRTVRNLAELEEARAAGADYAGLGPIFPTSTKAVPHPLLGVEGLRRICSQTDFPVVAIGGIRRDTIHAVASAGAHCAAVAGALLEGEDLVAAARSLADVFKSVGP